MEFSFVCSLFNLFSAIFMVKVTFKVSVFESIPRSDVCTVIIRCVAGVICFLTITAAPKFLPIAIFQITYNTQIFTVAVLACCWLNERISLCEALAMVLAFSGIVLIAISK